MYVQSAGRRTKKMTAIKKKFLGMWRRRKRRDQRNARAEKKRHDKEKEEETYEIHDDEDELFSKMQ